MASNGLAEFFSRAADREGEQPLENVVEAAVAKAVEELADVEQFHSSLGGERMRLFLRSPEVSNAVRQIFAADHGKELADVERELYGLWRVRSGDEVEESEKEVLRLFSTLIALCQRSLDAAIAGGSLTALEASHLRRHAEIRGSLQSLERSISLLSRPQDLDFAEIEQFAAKYRRQVAAREGNITPPALDSARAIPIDSLYVPARLAELDSDASQAVTYGDFARGLFRRVVLGNPGSGKSTLAKKLVADIARGRITVGGRQPELVPFLIVLRDFGAQKKERPCSIIDFIADTCNSRYQVAAPPSAIEYLLLTNRAMVVFDGLDELLDTTHRADISGDVESFAHLYPAVPLLVTSREVGYSQAPLSVDAFTPFRLTTFSDPEVYEYAQKWFSVADKGFADQARDQAARFMSDSAMVADLRSNALMLGLMCNLYKGSGYIPRNRPDVYEACADLLFDRWDRLRQIGKPLQIESLLRPTMQHLAAWIYGDPELQSGVTEEQLILAAKEFLLYRRFRDDDEAEFEARRFIEFCRGRAWVFTDMGTTSAGDRLYQFTHRTFLEFFTAGYLVRKYPDPESLLEVLSPHISAGEWDVVAQLSFQLLEHNREGAADQLLTMLVADSDKRPDRSIKLDFAIRALEFLVPSPLVASGLAQSAISGLEVLPDDAQSYRGDLRDRDDRVDTILELAGANPENASPIENAMTLALSAYIHDDRLAPYAAELALHFELGMNVSEKAGGAWLPAAVRNHMLDKHSDQLTALGDEDWRVGSDLLMLGAFGPQRYLDRHGLQPWLLSRTYRLFPNTRRVALAELVVGQLLWETGSRISLETTCHSLAALAAHLTKSTLSNIPVNGAGGTWLSSASGGPSVEARDIEVADLSSDQLYAFLTLMAIIFERSSRTRFGMSRNSSPLANLAGTLLDGRSSPRGWRSAGEMLSGLGLSGPQHELLKGWFEGQALLNSAKEG